MEDGYNIIRSSMMVRDPSRMATLIPPIIEEYVPPTREELKVMRIHRAKKIVRKILLITGIVIAGLVASVGGALLLEMVPYGEGLNILWGIFCGMAMVIPITGIIDD